MKINNAYKPRPLRFREVVKEDGWQVKLYTISANSEFPANELITAATANLKH